MKNTLCNTWISGASLAAVLLVSGLTPVEARAIAHDHTAAQATTDQKRDAGEVVSDSWITTKVKSKLVADSDASGFDISVETRNNVVHLSGEVDTQAQIDHAVSIARDIKGVARVDASELRFDTAMSQLDEAVDESADAFRSRETTSRTASQTSQQQSESRYRDGSRTETNPDMQRRAETNVGRDTTGTDRSHAGRDSSGTDRSQTGRDTMGTDRSHAGRDNMGADRSAAARDATGTDRTDRTAGRGTDADRSRDRSSDSDRSMGDATGDTWLTTKVKSKLLADSDVSGFDISVETRDDVVHLTGEVRTQALHDTAVRLARETEGVTRVDHSKLVVTGR